MSCMANSHLGVYLPQHHGAVMDLLTNATKAIKAVMENDPPGPTGDANYETAFASSALGSAEAWECELVKMAKEINKVYGGDRHHKEAERVCHLQLHTLHDAIADVKSEYRKVLVCLRLGTDTPKPQGS